MGGPRSCTSSSSSSSFGVEVGELGRPSAALPGAIVSPANSGNAQLRRSANGTLDLAPHGRHVFLSQELAPEVTGDGGRLENGGDGPKELLGLVL